MKPAVAAEDAAELLARHVARALREMASAEQDTVEAAANAVVLAERAGHACVPMADLKTDASRILASDVVGRPGDTTPLILDLDRLYLHRLHDQETRLAARLRDWLSQPDLPVVDDVVTDVLHQAGLATADSSETDWQAWAVRAACRRPLAVISGGPGTGKTRTAAVLLRALTRLTPGLRVALAAPTGKAAARLEDSIARIWKTLGPADESAETSSAETSPAATATTLHRLLGASAEGRRFRHGPENPLPFDVVLVDEASMVDLAMMCRLVTALRPDARLVLLGDKDQLASVDAGYVLGDICEAMGVNPPGPATATAVELRRNFRFGEDSAIGRLSALVRDGSANDAIALLRGLPDGAEIRWQRPETETDLRGLVGGLFGERIEPRFQPASAEAALERMATFQILCAVRRGPWGVEGLNVALEQKLEAAGLRQPGQTWYPGRPVLVTVNDAGLGLFNGDLGLAWPDAEGRLRVWFRTGDTARVFTPAQLPPHETAHAITVHKSQGSEFEEVLLVLQPGESPVCTRELVYTGLTRARKRAEIWASHSALTEAIGRRVRRASGLRERLGGR